MCPYLHGVNALVHTGSIGAVVAVLGIVHVAAVGKLLCHSIAASGHDVRRFLAQGVALGMTQLE